MKYKFGMIAATLLIVSGLSAFAVLRSQNTGPARNNKTVNAPVWALQTVPQITTSQPAYAPQYTNTGYPGAMGADAYSEPATRYPNSATNPLRANQLVIINQIRATNDPKTKNELAGKLTEKLQEEFEEQIKKRLVEISTLEQKLIEAKKLLEIRKNRRNDIIARRVIELTNIQDALSWESGTDGSQSNQSMPTPIHPPTVYGVTYPSGSSDQFSTSNQSKQSVTPSAALPSLPPTVSSVAVPAVGDQHVGPSMSSEAPVSAISAESGTLEPLPLAPSQAPIAVGTNPVGPTSGMSGISDRLDSSLTESAIEILGKLEGQAELFQELTPSARKQELAPTNQKFQILKLKVDDELSRLEIVKWQLNGRRANQKNRVDVEVNELKSQEELHARGAISQSELARQKQKVDDEETKSAEIEGEIILLELGKATLVERVTEIEKLLNRFQSDPSPLIPPSPRFEERL